MHTLVYLLEHFDVGHAQVRDAASSVRSIPKDHTSDLTENVFIRASGVHLMGNLAPCGVWARGEHVKASV